MISLWLSNTPIPHLFLKIHKQNIPSMSIEQKPSLSKPGRRQSLDQTQLWLVQNFISGLAPLLPYQLFQRSNQAFKQTFHTWICSGLFFFPGFFPCDFSKQTTHQQLQHFWRFQIQDSGFSLDLFPSMHAAELLPSCRQGCPFMSFLELVCVTSCSVSFPLGGLCSFVQQ